MDHIHHIIENHNGVRVRTNKTVTISLSEHASRHKWNFDNWGFWQDDLAYKGLLKMINKEELIHRQLSNAGRTGGLKTMSKKNKEDRTKFAKIGAKANWEKNKDKILETLRENGKKYGHLGGAKRPHIWITNGKETKKVLASEPIAKGWRRGRHSRSNR